VIMSRKFASTDRSHLSFRLLHWMTRRIGEVADPFW